MGRKCCASKHPLGPACSAALPRAALAGDNELSLPSAWHRCPRCSEPWEELPSSGLWPPQLCSHFLPLDPFPRLRDGQTVLGVLQFGCGPSKQAPAEPLCMQGHSPALPMANSTGRRLLPASFRHQNPENSCFLLPYQRGFEWDPIRQGEGANTKLVGGSHHSWG